MKLKSKYKIKKNKLLYLAPIISFAPALIIFSCKNESSENFNNTLDQELNRLNNMKLELIKNQISLEEFNSTTQDNFLLKMIRNLNPSKYFDYAATNFSKENNQFKFKIIITNNQNSRQSALSNYFNINFEIKEYKEINDEINRLNQSNNINLFQTSFTQKELDKIDQNNFINYLWFSKKDNFKYSVINFNKLSNNKFSFQIEIFAKELNTLKKSSVIIEKDYSITPPIANPSTTIEQEINRLNNNLMNVKFVSPNITFKELQEINLDNLLPRIIGLDLDTTNFSYKADSMNKDDTSNSKKIGFVIRVYDNKTTPNNNTNFTNRIEISFNLIKNEQSEYVSEEYLKNNLADVYTGGGYDLAKPGSGIGNDDVIASQGPLRTAPSEGVSEFSKSIKSKVFNSTELKQLKNTFSLAFKDFSGGTALGTGWILDFKLTDDGSYPTTWYIATNSHVIQNLKIPNDVISPERYEVENSNYYNTEQLIMRRVKTENIENGTWNYGDDFGHNSFTTYDRVDLNFSNLKTVFIGNDYLTTSPQMYSKSGIWSDSEEYIDFAVMEVTFDTPEQAKSYTQNYANEPERHFKYRQESILKNYNLKKEKAYSVIGFPDIQANYKPWFRNVSMYSSRGANDQNEPLFPEDNNKFSNLASSPYYNTFNDRVGMFDAALGLSFFGYNYRQAYGLTTWYNSWGLTYPIDYSNLGEGSSGSMLMDDEGYTLGIYFAADARASIGLAQALYCEGFNYQNKFGNFNLQGYDLINGGFPNQKISYKDNLRKLYGNNYKTNLFKNGLN